MSICPNVPFLCQTQVPCTPDSHHPPLSLQTLFLIACCSKILRWHIHIATSKLLQNICEIRVFLCVTYKPIDTFFNISKQHVLKQLDCFAPTAIHGKLHRCVWSAGCAGLRFQWGTAKRGTTAKLKTMNSVERNNKIDSWALGSRVASGAVRHPKSTGHDWKVTSQCIACSHQSSTRTPAIVDTCLLNICAARHSVCTFGCVFVGLKTLHSGTCQQTSKTTRNHTRLRLFLARRGVANNRSTATFPKSVWWNRRSLCQQKMFVASLFRYRYMQVASNIIFGHFVGFKEARIVVVNIWSHRMWKDGRRKETVQVRQ